MMSPSVHVSPHSSLPDSRLQPQLGVTKSLSRIIYTCNSDTKVLSDRILISDTSAYDTYPYYCQHRESSSNGSPPPPPPTAPAPPRHPPGTRPLPPSTPLPPVLRHPLRLRWPVFVRAARTAELVAPGAELGPVLILPLWNQRVDGAADKPGKRPGAACRTGVAGLLEAVGVYGGVGYTGY